MKRVAFPYSSKRRDGTTIRHTYVIANAICAISYSKLVSFLSHILCKVSLSDTTELITMAAITRAEYSIGVEMYLNSRCPVTFKLTKFIKVI